MAITMAKYRAGDKVILLGTKSDGSDWNEWRDWNDLTKAATPGMIVTIGYKENYYLFFNEFYNFGRFTEKDVKPYIPEPDTDGNYW